MRTHEPVTRMPPRIRIQTLELCPAPDHDALEFARTRLDFQPDDVQASILSGRKRRLLLNCSRQWGKSTVAGAKAVWQAVTHPASEIIVISPTEAQSAEFVRKTSVFVRKLGLRVRGDGRNRISLAFPNESRIVGLSDVDDSARGFSNVSLLIVDEAARVRDDAYHGARAFLVKSAGDLWLLSTPKGRRGFFYEEWIDRSREWERFSVPARECSRIPAAALDDERLTLGDDLFRQEYECEFLSGGGSYFDRSLIEAAFECDVPALKV